MDMKEMAKPKGLQKKKQGYYIRVRVPVDLVERLGKKEIVRSLKTQDYKTACKRCDEERVKITQMFDASLLEKKSNNSQKTNLSTLTKTHMLTIANEWLNEQDQNHEEIVSEEQLTEGQWYERLDTLRTDEGIAGHAIKENDLNFCRDLVEKCLSEKNISYSVDSLEFRQLHRLFMEAFLESSTRAILRHKGKPIQKPHNHKFNISLETASEPNRNSITLGQLVDEYFGNKGKAWSKKTRLDYETALNLMLEFIGKDKFVESVSRQDCRSLSNKMKRYPSNLRKSYPASKYSLLEAYKSGVSKGMRPISISTYNDYIGKFASLMKYALQETYISENPATGLQEKDHVSTKNKRNAFTSKELHKIFTAPIYTGCIDANYGQNKKGTFIPVNSYKFWLPLIGLWTGMRLGEICQLEYDDIDKVDGIDVIKIRESEDDTKSAQIAFSKRVKNKNAIRYIPIHPELKKIGLLNFVNRDNNTSSLLFNDIKGYKGSLSYSPSRWFNETFLPKQIEKTSKTVFHSFRHTYRDGLRMAEIPIEAICLLGGWSSGDAVHNSYGDGYSAEKLFEYIERLKYPDLDLSHLYTIDNKTVDYNE